MVSEKVFEHTLPGIGGRRHQQRHKIPADVMIVPLDGSAKPFWATTEDVSTRGIFITSSRRPPIDTPLLLKLVIHNNPHPHPLRVKVKVVHRIDGIGFGCKFVDMAPTTSKALSSIVASAVAAPRFVRTVH